MRWLRCALTLVAAAFALPSFADEIRPSVVELTQRGATDWALDWKFPLTADRSGSYAAATPKPIKPSTCEYSFTPATRTVDFALVGTAHLQCQGRLAGQTLGVDGLFGRADALLRVIPLDAAPQTFRLTAASPTATVLAEPSRWQVVSSYFVTGIDHILAGWDHLLFVIALVLLVTKTWSAIKAATAFTVAHSITLIASTLGYAGLPGRPVEILIALSIVFLAVELAKSIRVPDMETWTRKVPWLVAFAFGLLHGFGFAGALAEIGLPLGEVPAALLAFNLGVEAGQLLVIAVVLAVRFLVVRFAPKVETPALKAATYAIGIIASYWLIERIAL